MLICSTKIKCWEYLQKIRPLSFCKFNSGAIFIPLFNRNTVNAIIKIGKRLGFRVRKQVLNIYKSTLIVSLYGQITARIIKWIGANSIQKCNK